MILKTIEDHIKLYIGDMVVQLVKLDFEKESLLVRVQELEKELEDLKNSDLEK